MSRADALALLATYSLRAAKVEIVKSELEAGSVISQSPAGMSAIGGTPLPDPDNDAITITVSGGADYTEPEITDSPETTSTPETTDSPVTTEAPTPDITDAPETTYAPETTGELPELT